MIAAVVTNAVAVVVVVAAVVACTPIEQSLTTSGTRQQQPHLIAAPGTWHCSWKFSAFVVVAAVVVGKRLKWKNQKDNHTKLFINAIVL